MNRNQTAQFLCGWIEAVAGLVDDDPLSETFYWSATERAAYAAALSDFYADADLPVRLVESELRALATIREAA